MLCSDGKISLYSYIGTIISFTFLYIPVMNFNFLAEQKYTIILAPAIIYILINVVIRVLYRNNDYQVAVRAALLGFAFALGVYIIIKAPYYTAFGVYMCVMSFFHYSEFLSIAVIQPTKLSTNSYMLYHSPQYVGAAVTSWIEFFLEIYFFPEIKSFIYISYVGLAICVVGEFLRKLAMLTAHTNFNHLVQCTKADDHVLVTHGIYGLCRHPSYVGWFYWSIGTQIILMNPICIVGYTLASWFFFNERIHIEEITLLNFFGQQYCVYQENVGTGLPFIKGYRIRP